ncbi:Response regulator protein VraR [Defluviimonas aquaemixtae]|uniref:Response regulator protein VraR n=1 Tax=Albidovulum aquaemixtae TaxID=1542388 RepID=A0A2R8B2B2_9RHOB|nr:helix-turn-helix transcriptional regulator [Defluviimonas aquaemixtae]SPH16685.1 Response regulator protein VraR [Defluviimonas aquaemixtae]
MGLDDRSLADLKDALAALERDGWAALPALARLDATGHLVRIDLAASRIVGAPVVLVREGPRTPSGLTPRQAEVAMAVARGMSNAEIADALGISVATVKDHVHAILDRLEVKRRGEIGALLHARVARG